MNKNITNIVHFGYRKTLGLSFICDILTDIWLWIPLFAVFIQLKIKGMIMIDTTDV